MITPLGKALGVKYKEPAKTKQSKVLPDDLTVEEVLARIGGKGTMVN